MLLGVLIMWGLLFVFCTRFTRSLARSPRADIKVIGRDAPKPCATFEQMGLERKLLAVIERLQFDEPTAIQAQGGDCSCHASCALRRA